MQPFRDGSSRIQIIEIKPETVLFLVVFVRANEVLELGEPLAIVIYTRGTVGKSDEALAIVCISPSHPFAAVLHGVIDDMVGSFYFKDLDHLAVQRAHGLL